MMCQQSRTKLISKAEVERYYTYLLNAFKSEFIGSSRREVIEQMTIGSRFSSKDSAFLKRIVDNAFARKDPYKKVVYGTYHYQHPIELLDYIVSEGYTPSSPFVIWAHKKLGVRWSALHWYRFLLRDIAPVDLVAIRSELKRVGPYELPPTLEFYYRIAGGIERVQVDADLGIRNSLRSEFGARERYKGFDPLDYMDYYYGGLDREDMTIARTFYEILFKNYRKLPLRSSALIVGNGPVPDEAQTLAMIPRIGTIIPADVDERNIKIMRMHTGGKSPLATQKARPGEEHADFINYLFERSTKIHFGFFAVREITSVKTIDPVYVDITRPRPLDLPRNSKSIKQLKAELVVVPFCPESITNSLERYREYIKNISNLIERKNHLCMLALKNARYYTSGVKRLDAAPIDETIVCEELTKNGFTNIQITTIDTGFDARRRGFSDSMIIWADKK